MDSSKTGSIVDWVRPHRTEKLAIPKNNRRPYLFGSPVLTEDLSKLLDYDDSNQELGISIVLCYRLWRALFYTESLAKQAFWFVKHLCERTDMREEKIPIRFCITNDVGEIAMPYIRACNFPNDKIDWVESREPVYPQSTKFIGMQHSSLKHVDKVLHLDLCYLIDTDETQHKGTWFNNVNAIWQSEPFAQSHPFIMSDALGNRVFTEHRSTTLFDRDWGDGVPPEEHLLWRTLSDFLGESPAKLKHYFMNDDEIADISGGCFGMSRHLLDNLDLETDIYPAMRVTNDECALEAYAYREKWTNEDVCDIGSAFRWVNTTAPVELNGEYGIRYVDQQLSTDIWMDQYE